MHWEVNFCEILSEAVEVIHLLHSDSLSILRLWAFQLQWDDGVAPRVTEVSSLTGGVELRVRAS